jgi:CheY-like chemotaxis protein
VIIIDYAVGAGLADELRRLAAGHGQARVLVALSPQERRELGRPRDAGYAGHLVRPVRVSSLLNRLAPDAETSTGMATLMPGGNMARQASGLRVLVAEDNEINALIVLKTLERQGAVAVWARDGREALSLASAALQGQGAAFDLVLMDVRMPHMDGLEATRQLRALEKAQGAAPLAIIGVSANVAAEDVAQARLAGMDDCLPKPLDREALLAWLARSVAGKEHHAAA